MKAFSASVLIAVIVFTRFSVGAAGENLVAPTSTTTGKPGKGVSLAALQQERATLEKRLSEVNASIRKIQVGQGIQFLGLMVADPTSDMMKSYNLDRPQPLVLGVSDKSFFQANMAPYEGCAVSMVEHPGNGFLFMREVGPSYNPRNVYELLQAIVSCAISPEEYQRLAEQTARAARERANAIKDDDWQRQKMLGLANLKLPPEARGKYVCRVVYNYPHKGGTVTTQIFMTRDELERLRELLKQ